MLSSFEIAIRRLESKEVAVKLGRALLRDLRTHPVDLGAGPEQLPELRRAEQVSKCAVSQGPEAPTQVRTPRRLSGAELGYATPRGRV